MKKLYLFLLLPLFIACSSDDEPTTDPQKGDAMTTEQIVGTYIASYIRFDNTNDGLFETKLELTFNADQTGEERNPTTLEKTPFAWSYNANERVIYFSYSLHQNIKGWFDNSNLKYRDYYIDGEQTDKIATHTYRKK